jgi:ABC-2 type transport system permease protein
MQLRKALTIAKRDYLATVRTKAFLFGLVVAPVLFGGGSIAGTFLKGKPNLSDRRIAIVDYTGAVADVFATTVTEKTNRESFVQETHRQIAPRYVVESVTPAGGAQLLELSERVRNKQLAAFVVISKDALAAAGAREDKAHIAYYTNAGGIDETRNWLIGPLQDASRLARLKQLGIDVASHPGLAAPVNVESMGLVERDAAGAIRPATKRNEFAAFMVPFAVALVLTMIVMVGSAPMLQNVTQDKSQRVVETLLGAATPLELMAGKVFGAVGVSLTSSVLYVGAGTFAVHALGLSGMLPLTVIPWFYAFLLADVIMLCAWAAALGACCSSPQDAQNLAVVLIMPCVLPMFLLVPVIQQPNGVLATVLSLIPPLTPALMLLRQAVPEGVPVWQPWVGLAGVVVFAAATVWAASRIFRIAILMQGKPPRLGEMARWALKG